MQFCNLKNKKKTQIFAQIGCFGRQIFQTRPNFIDLGALVCDSYPSIDIPKIVKIDQQTQAQVCMYTNPRITTS